jgi:hypothetical protein
MSYDYISENYVLVDDDFYRECGYNRHVPENRISANEAYEKVKDACSKHKNVYISLKNFLILEVEQQIYIIAFNNLCIFDVKLKDLHNQVILKYVRVKQSSIILCELIESFYKKKNPFLDFSINDTKFLQYIEYKNCKFIDYHLTSFMLSPEFYDEFMTLYDKSNLDFRTNDINSNVNPSEMFKVCIKHNKTYFLYLSDYYYHVHDLSVLSSERLDKWLTNFEMLFANKVNITLYSEIYNIIRQFLRNIEHLNSYILDPNCVYDVIKNKERIMKTIDFMLYEMFYNTNGGIDDIMVLASHISDNLIFIDIVLPYLSYTSETKERFKILIETNDTILSYVQYHPKFRSNPEILFVKEPIINTDFFCIVEKEGLQPYKFILERNMIYKTLDEAEILPLELIDDIMLNF